MISLAPLVLWVLSWAPNDVLLAAHFGAADALEQRLVPWRELLEPARPLWLVVNRRQRGVPAVFVAQGQRSELLYALGESERALTELEVPRLLLSVEHFRGSKALGDGSWDSRDLTSLELLASDSVQYLTRALLEARWAKLLQVDELLAEVDRLAAAAMPSVASPYRRDAFLTAVNDFGSHILSMSHEIGRHQRRRLARGETLCGVLAHPATLFGSWRRAFEEGEYRGFEPRERASSGAATPRGGGVDWVMTKEALRNIDKRWLLGHLKLEWTGDPEVDFKFLCNPQEPQP